MGNKKSRPRPPAAGDVVVLVGEVLVEEEEEPLEVK